MRNKDESFESWEGIIRVVNKMWNTSKVMHWDSDVKVHTNCWNFISMWKEKMSLLNYYYSKGLSISFLYVLECSLHVGYKWVLENLSMTRDKILGGG